jgi:hypothetical protein
MAKDCSRWLDKSKATYGDKSGGGSVGRGSGNARMGKKNGGEDGPTPYGDSKGGGKEPRGKDRPLNAPKGIKTWKR